MQHNLDWANVQQVIIVIAAFAATYTVLFSIKRLLWRKLKRWASNGKPDWYGLLLKSIQPPLTLIFFTVSIGIALQASPSGLRDHPAPATASRILLILAIFWLIDRAVSVFIRSGTYSEKLSVTTKTLLLSATRMVVIAFSGMIVLETLGISITPILASLGIGSVAIALALQDTLSNLFSGVYVLIDKPVRIGDIVRLEDGTEGIVRRIGWRSTQIETLAHNMVVIPNIKLAGSILTNYDLPSSEMSLVLPMGVAYESDLEKVERVTIAATKEILRIDGFVPTFEPVVRFTSFADSSINFNLVVRVRAMSDVSLVRHSLIKHLHARYAKEQIDIPFPQRTIRMMQFQSEQPRTSMDART